MPDLIAINPEPVAADVIATLERVIEMARDGELSSVAIALVYRDGAASADWSALPSRPAMLGAISMLAHKINVDAGD